MSNIAPVSGWASACSSRQPRDEIEHRQRIGGEPDLAVAGQFGDAVDEIARVEIAVAGLQQLVDDGIEMQRGDQRGQVGGGFVEAVIFGARRSRIGHADDRIDDAVPDLVRDDVEVQAEGLDAAVLASDGCRPPGSRSP